MEPVPHRPRGTAVPLDRSDVDTDQIIPAEWLKRVERTGFGGGLFSTWRDDRDFVLNDERYDGATILVAGPNFGTGSSREHAVWAILDYGFEAVGRPASATSSATTPPRTAWSPVQVPPEVGERLMRAVEADPDLEVTIDVERRTRSAPGGWASRSSSRSTTPPSERFLEGLDDIGITLRNVEAIDSYETERSDWLPSAAGLTARRPGLTRAAAPGHASSQATSVSRGLRVVGPVAVHLPPHPAEVCPRAPAHRWTASWASPRRS